jgi:hypothetical protein
LIKVFFEAGDLLFRLPGDPLDLFNVDGENGAAFAQGDQREFERADFAPV